MRIWSLALLLLLTGCSTPSLLAPPLPQQTILDPDHPALTRLWRRDGGFQCTGFYVQGPSVPTSNGFQGPQIDSWLVTAGHCASPYTTAARSPYDRKAPVRWLKAVSVEPGQMVNDVAVGVVEGAHSLLPLAKETPFAGRVWVVGFGYGIAGVTAASIAAIDGDGSWTIHPDHGAPLRPGSSGSPVVDMEGKVVGVLWGVKCERAFWVWCQEWSTEVAYITPIKGLYDLWNP